MSDRFVRVHHAIYFKARPDARLTADMLVSMLNKYEDQLAVCDTEVSDIRNQTWEKAADLMDKMWNEQVRDRPEKNYLRAGLDSAYRQAARRLRALKPAPDAEGAEQLISNAPQKTVEWMRIVRRCDEIPDAEGLCSCAKRHFSELAARDAEIERLRETLTEFRTEAQRPDTAHLFNSYIVRTVDRALKPAPAPRED